jgi:AcrR family transcriptional regulator
MPKQKPNIAAITNHAKPALQQRSRRSLDRLVRAASRVLSRDGFDSVTISSVAREAGVSVGGIYRRFKSKQALMLAIHDWLVSDIEVAVREQLADITDLRGAVRAFVDVIANRLSSNEELSKMVFRMNQPSDEQWSQARKAIQGTYHIFRETVLVHQAELAHSNVEVAIAVGFHLVYASVMGRIGKPDVPPFSHVPWPVLRQELAVVVFSYLTGQQKKR